MKLSFVVLVCGVARLSAQSVPSADVESPPAPTPCPDCSPFKQELSSCRAEVGEVHSQLERLQVEFNTRQEHCANELSDVRQKYDDLRESSKAQVEEVQAGCAAQLSKQRESCSSAASEELSKATEALSECQVRHTETLNELNQHKDQSTDEAKQWSAQKASLESEVREVKRRLSEAVSSREEISSKFRASKNELEEKLKRVRLELAKSAAEGMHLISRSQLKRSANHLVVLTKALLNFVLTKAPEALPSAVVEDGQAYLAHLRAGCLGVYRAKIAPEVQKVKIFIAPHMAKARALYEERMVKFVSQARSGVKESSRIISKIVIENTKRVIVLSSHIVNEKIAEPLIKSNPKLKDILPPEPIDRLLSIYFCVAVTISSFIISLRLLKCLLRPLKKSKPIPQAEKPAKPVASPKTKKFTPAKNVKAEETTSSSSK